MDDFSPSTQNAPPFIYEENGRLTLHFQIGEVQSEMVTAYPDALTLPYTAAMMGFLLFDSRPRHIAMLGLGGGSLAKYCYRYLAHSRISVAEISPEVIALRDQFYIPRDDHRFHIYCEDGAHFVNRHAGTFDVLMVDAFDIDGQPVPLCTRHFYDNCYRALAPDGMLVVNLCDHRSRILATRIRESFRDSAFAIRCPGGENRIVFAGKGNAFVTPNDSLVSSIEALKHRHPISVDWQAMCHELTQLRCARAPRFQLDGTEQQADPL